MNKHVIRKVRTMSVNVETMLMRKAEIKDHIACLDAEQDASEIDNLQCELHDLELDLNEAKTNENLDE